MEKPEQKKEHIVLDARVAEVIDSAAFLAELGNGHRFVAYVHGPDRGRVEGVKPGTVVQVQFSPFDMSRARIVQIQQETNGESPLLGKKNL